MFAVSKALNGTSASLSSLEESDTTEVFDPVNGCSPIVLVVLATHNRGKHLSVFQVLWKE